MEGGGLSDFPTNVLTDDRTVAYLLSTYIPLQFVNFSSIHIRSFNPYPTAFPYGNGMVLHFYQQQESSTNKTVQKVLTRDLKLVYSRLTLVRISINL